MDEQKLHENKPLTPPRLTQTVSKGGCAAKLAAGSLSELVRKLPQRDHPDLLVGNDSLDDAAAWRLDPETALLQTLDFFTPIVDDPRDFGRVAAANALSDVFAMGGTPIMALTILAYPTDRFGPEVLDPMMSGAVATIHEAGALLVGGHTIDDDTLKLGFAVSGTVHPDRLWSNHGARPGDVLLLTKAVGTGTLTGALKNDEIGYSDLKEAIASMVQLNRLQLPDDLRATVRAATDVTGFGLLGHALNLARSSGVSLLIESSKVPLLQHADWTLERGILTKAHGTNTSYVEGDTYGREALTEVEWLALVDPQTSGGLLLSVDCTQADAVLAALLPVFPRAARIGEVLEQASNALVVS
jgi:selenide,water dikinase